MPLVYAILVIGGLVLAVAIGTALLGNRPRSTKDTARPGAGFGSGNTDR